MRSYEAGRSMRDRPVDCVALQALSSVSPQEGSMSPYSGSGLEGNTHR